MTGVVMEVGERSLAEFATELTRAHALVQQAADEVLIAAANVGVILLEAKRQRQAMRPGDWRVWVTDNLPFSYATARLYIQCAKHRTVIENQGWTRITQVRDGLAALIGPDNKGKGITGKTKPEWMKTLARDMYSDGIPIAHIAKELGVNHSSVKGWVDPEWQAAARKKQAACNKRRILAERALIDRERDQSIKRAVSSVSGALSEAYAMAERMQDVIGQAHREMNDTEGKRALSLAGEHYRRMRDEIVRALGVQP